MSIEYIRVEPYQDFNLYIKMGGWAISAAAAVYFAWHGRRAWAPPEDELSDYSRRIAVLLSTVPILLLWTLCFHCSAMPQLIGILIVAAIMLIGLASYYRYLNHMLIFPVSDHEEAPARRIIGGTKLTEVARQLADKKGLSPSQLLTTFDNMPERVWTHSSRGVAKTWLIFVYLILTVAGTTILACCAMMLFISVISSQEHRTLSIQPKSKVLRGNNYYQFDITGRLCRPDLRYKLTPDVGTFDNGLYRAPDKVANPQAIELKVISGFSRRDYDTAIVLLLPDSTDSTRDTVSVQTPEGNAGMVDIIRLSDRYSWMFEDVALLSNGLIAREVIEGLAKDRLFDAYQDIVAVGTASHEFKKESLELDRAQTRADTIADAICAQTSADSGATSKRTVFTLNLGRFQAASSRLVSKDLSAAERKIIVFGVIRRTKVLDIDWAVRHAVESKSSKEHDGNGFFTTLLRQYPRQWNLTVRCRR